MCLVGGKGIELNNPNNKIVTEYEDAEYQLSSFELLTKLGVKGSYFPSHGNTESLISNGLADLGIMIVESGHTLAANDLVLYHEIRTIQLNFWINSDNPKGYELLKKYRPEIIDVYVDGIDGSGKGTLISSLKQDKKLKNHVFHDRSILTKLTLFDDSEYPKAIPGKYIVLDCDYKVAHQRCSRRATPVDEKWENLNALSYFQHRYRELAVKYGLFLLDNTTLTVDQEHSIISDYLLNNNTSHVMPKIDDLTESDFNKLQLVAQGESKIIHSINDRFDVLQMIPSIYSHKKRRAGFIPGSDKERMQMTKYVLRLLAYEQIPHTYWYVGSTYILVEKLTHSPPRVEVVVKSRWAGTDKYRFVGLNECKSRLTGDKLVGINDLYPNLYCRIDWRNSNEHVEGDVAITEDLANHLINVTEAKKLVLRTFEAYRKHLNGFGVDLHDICFFVTQEGDKIYNEISQDNARYASEREEFGKNPWRSGNSSEAVLDNWKKITTMIRDYTNSFFAKLYA